jgi:NAD-specific glutamate dehydrogenase
VFYGAIKGLIKESQKLLEKKANTTVGDNSRNAMIIQRVSQQEVIKNLEIFSNQIQQSNSNQKLFSPDNGLSMNVPHTEVMGFHVCQKMINDFLVLPLCHSLRLFYACLLNKIQKNRRDVPLE